MPHHDLTHLTDELDHREPAHRMRAPDRTNRAAHCQLSVGFGVSIALMVLSLALIRQPLASANDPAHTRAVVQSAGVLQLTWLLGHEPHIATVPEPDVHALRVAGMFDVQLSAPRSWVALGGGEADEKETFLRSEPNVLQGQHA